MDLPAAHLEISYGPGAPRERDLRLCGELTGGRRTLELGVSPHANAVALGRAGAKSIAVDPRPEVIADLRARASAEEVRVECHVADLADLGFATSGSIELVLAVHTIEASADLGRLLRQVHRVLRPGAPFVIMTRHPFAAMVEDLRAGSTLRPYGAVDRTFEQWSTSLERANFRLDVLRELTSAAGPPDLLAMRARKEGS